MPTHERVKVAVAIKVLNIRSSSSSVAGDVTSGTTNRGSDGGGGRPSSPSCSLDAELLEEARIMASVCHPCCMKIAAVSLGKQPKLVTQLMPYGALLDYVRKNRSNVGSHVLLNWSTQIASVSI